VSATTSSGQHQAFAQKVKLSEYLNIYRYISLFVTSLLYLAGPPAAAFPLKLGVCACLLAEACLFIKVYNAEKSGDRKKKLLVFLEMAGLIFVLYVTGGMASPFLWYAINPILLSASLLPRYFCWLLLAFFTCMVLAADRLTVYKQAENQFFLPGFTIIIIFALFTLITQLYNIYLCSLQRQSALLEKQLRHIKSLYSAVEAFSQNTDPQEVINLFASYVKLLADVTKAIILVDVPLGLKGSQQKHYYTVRGPRHVLAEEEWYPTVKRLYIELQKAGAKAGTITLFEEGTLLTVPVYSRTKYYGIFSAFLPQHRGGHEETEQTMKFLAELCAVALDKYALESIAKEYMIAEEKDRIAGEIHDNVTQNLFALIYRLDLLLKKEQLGEEVKQQLRLIQRTAQQSLRDLRSSIYDMSTYKRREEPLVEDIRAYLGDFGALNNIQIDFMAENMHIPLSAALRNSLYRIIREATGNAVRHGHCSQIKVEMTVTDDQVKLSVTDNGCGFTPTPAATQGGLGLINMKELARSLGGTLLIHTGLQKGTKILCQIPLDYIRKEVPAN